MITPFEAFFLFTVAVNAVAVTGWTYYFVKALPDLVNHVQGVN